MTDKKTPAPSQEESTQPDELTESELDVVSGGRVEKKQMLPPDDKSKKLAEEHLKKGD